jgi:hypothetical protein
MTFANTIDAYVKRSIQSLSLESELFVKGAKKSQLAMAERLNQEKIEVLGRHDLSWLLFKARILRKSIDLRRQQFRLKSSWIGLCNDGMLLFSHGGAALAKFAIVDSERSQSRSEALKSIVLTPDRDLRIPLLIVWLASHPDDVESLLGDLTESYPQREEHLGVSRAHAWLWRQALGSMWQRLQYVVTLFGLLSFVCRYVEKHLGR